MRRMDDAPTIDPVVAFELAALRLHLLVGMAAADDRLHEDELARLDEFLAHCEVEPSQRAALRRLRGELVVQPPALDELLRRLVDGINSPQLAQLLVDDLVQIARSDGHVDAREEGLLRLVCGALEVDPVSLYDDHERAGADVGAAELAALVRRLLDLDRAA